MRIPFTCIYREIWDDEVFCDLPDHAKLVCFYVFTCTFGNGVGCFKAGFAAMHEESRMQRDQFVDGFKLGMDAGFFMYDKKRRVVYIPQYFKRNEPANPNALISLAKEFVKVPACELKAKCYQYIKQWVTDKGGKFPGTFDEYFEEIKGFESEPSANVAPNVPGNVTPNVAPNVEPNVPANVTPNVLDKQSQSKSPSVSKSKKRGSAPLSEEKEHQKRLREQRPEDHGHDRSTFSKPVQEQAAVLEEYFPHIGPATCTEWAYKLNNEFGEKLKLKLLFEEIGKTYTGNENKPVYGREWGHIRSWCNNELGRPKGRFRKEGVDASQPIDMFMSRDGRPRFDGGFFKPNNKTVREAVDIAAEDGSMPKSIIGQWYKDLDEYEAEVAAQEKTNAKG